MPPADERLPLVQMLEAAREAIALAQQGGRPVFESRRERQFALLYLIVVIGEAAGRVGPEMRARIQDVPWPDVVGMRHRVVHGYDTVNLTLVWDTVERDIPPLRAALEAALGPGF